LLSNLDGRFAQEKAKASLAWAAFAALTKYDEEHDV
jgi:hypothetical protein